MSTDARRIAVTMIAGLILGAAFAWAVYALDSDESTGVRLAATVPAALVFVAVSIGLVRVLDRMAGHAETPPAEAGGVSVGRRVRPGAG